MVSQNTGFSAPGSREFSLRLLEAPDGSQLQPVDDGPVQAETNL